MRIEYPKKAAEEIKRLPSVIGNRILDKMDWFVAQANPLSFAKALIGKEKQYRFRVGDYRVVCTMKNNTVSILFVLEVKNRDKAY